MDRRTAVKTQSRLHSRLAVAGFGRLIRWLRDWFRNQRQLSDGAVAHEPSPFDRRLRNAIAIAGWVYLALALALWIILRVGSERWWVATLFLFGPRWLALLPFLVLCPAALWRRRRSLPALLAASGIALIPIMGFCVPFGAALHGGMPGVRLRLMTCNIHGQALDRMAFGTLLEQVRPDVLVLQEWSSQHDPLFASEGWHVHRDGDLLLASRFPIRRVEDLAQNRWGSSAEAVSYELATPCGPVQVINVHLASPHPALEAVLDHSADAADQVRTNSRLRLEQSASISARAVAISQPLLIAGDFNTPGESRIFHHCWSGLTDAYSSSGWGLGYTYTSRRNAVRIDHVLYNARWECPRCYIGPDVGSPHRPVIAEMMFVK